MLRHGRRAVLNLTTVWVICLVGLFVLGCGGGDEETLEVTGTTDTAVVEQEISEDISEPVLEGSLSYSVNAGGDVTPVDANLGIRCEEVKPGQFYVSATYLAEGAISVGLRVGSPEGNGEKVTVTGLYEGQDASEGEALVSWSGELDAWAVEGFETAQGWVSLTSLDPCEGEFRFELVTGEEEMIVLEDGVFLIPLESP